VGSNGNGSNGRYTAQQFIDAIPGTGGIVSEIAKRVGCRWHTAKKYIDEYATVKEAWEAERNRITDTAESNIIKKIESGHVPLSKWWLKVMKRDVFDPPERRELSGPGGEPMEAKTTIVVREYVSGESS